MKKRILSVLLALVMCLTLLPTVTLTAQATTNDEEVYISELYLSIADSYAVAKSQLTDAGYTVYKDLDLNNKAGGAWILMGYKTTTDPMKAICAIYLYTKYEKSNTFSNEATNYRTITASLPQDTSETLTLTRVGFTVEGGHKMASLAYYYDKSENKYYDTAYGNLNTGTSGYVIWLYTCTNEQRDASGQLNPYTISPSDLNYYSDEDDSSSFGRGTGEWRVQTPDGEVSDLNKGTGSGTNYIYLKYEAKKHTHSLTAAKADDTNHTYSCTVGECSYTKSEAHSYDKDKADGKCTVCGAAHETHSFTMKTVNSTYFKSAATCESGNQYYYRCSTCGVSSKDNGGKSFASGDALGHDFSKKLDNTEYLAESSTCTSEETYYYACSRCSKSSQDYGGATYSRGAAQGHDYTAKNTGESYLAAAATCTEAATYYYSCSRCGQSSKGDTNVTFTSGNSLGHDYTSETADGQYLGICSVCGKYQPATYNEADNVYEISNAGQLAWFAALVNGDTTQIGITAAKSSANGKLTANIDLSAVCGESIGNWTPIGNSSNKYSGTFDGGGYTISGLRVSSSSSGGYVGLFGCIGEGGTVQNVKLKSVSVSSSGKTGYAGALCGYNNGGTIANCTVTGTVSTCGQSGSSGGVCGYNAGTISGCTSSVKVTASGKSAYAGGISGYNAKAGTISSCTSSGAVTTSGKSGKAGGICGYNAGKISSCSSTGKIRATGQSGKSGKIYGYNSGKVS